MIRLGDIGSAAIGLTYSPSAVADGGTLVLRSSNIQNEQLVFHNDVFVEMDVPLSSRVQPGDILVCARNGSRPLIGKSVLLDHRVEGMAFGAFMALFRSKFNNYVIHQFRSNGMRRQIEMHLGATINQITNSSLLSFEIPFPPSEKERDAIAEALSDADAAIESLNALIVKKRDVKQATMQQYAQAERVGPDARMVALGSVVVINKGELITSSTSGEGPYPVIAGGKSPAYFASKFNRDGLTITISASGANAGYVALRKGKIWASDCSTISEDSSIDMNYLAAQLEVRQEKIYKAQFGGAQPHVRPNDLAPLEICWVPLVQQQEIGRALRAMDDEIEALTKQVSKLRMMKEGMMQDLLTGKVRLV
jgi:type I restriction enzyme S subunit